MAQHSAGEEESENRNPQIQTRGLGRHRTILPPRPPPPPTKREIKEALKCRKSGMVPGAIRKYLLQKKKAEEDEDEDMLMEEEEEEEVDHEPGPELQEPPPPRGGGGEEEEEGLQVEVEHEEEVYCQVTPQSSTTSRSNGIRKMGKDKSKSSSEVGSRDREVAGTSGWDTDGGGSSKKRASSEAFSPDTTTPEEGIVPIPETTPALDSSLIEPEVEREGPPPRKKGRPSTSSKGRKGKKVPPTTRVAPFRKTKAVSSASSASSSPRSVIKVLTEQDAELLYSQALDDPEVDNWIRKNQWHKVISEFKTNLEFDKKVPKPHHIGDLIKKAILGFGTRVPRDIPEQALEFFSTLKNKYPIGGHESTAYYNEAFTKTSDDISTMPQFLFSLLEVLQADARANVPSKILPFFKQLTKMVVTQYKGYMSATVQLRHPFFVQFLEENEEYLSYNLYCKKLVEYTFQMKEAAEELRTVMRWVGLLAHHFKTHTRLEPEFDLLVEDIVERLTKSNFGSVCPMVQAIAESSLGSAVAMKIIRKRITFESIKDVKGPSEKEIASYLRLIAKTDMISGLKSTLVERRHSTDFPPLVASVVAANGKKAKPTVNRKGESLLHKLCRKVQSDTKDESISRLNDLLKRRHFDCVNPTDNFGNTPLHDAIANGRYDAVSKFCEYCSSQSLPEELRVNLLAQNQAGDTPFHLAAVSDQSENMTRVLCSMADKLQVKEEALKILNMQGKMPYELAFNAETRSMLKPLRISEWNFELGDVKIPPQCRPQLQSLEIRKLVLLWAEFFKQLKETNRFSVI